MNKHRDAFTDPLGLGNASPDFWGKYKKNIESVEDEKSEFNDTLPLFQDTVIADEIVPKTI
jgi:hypothetical protein